MVSNLGFLLQRRASEKLLSVLTLLECFLDEHCCGIRGGATENFLVGLAIARKIIDVSHEAMEMSGGPGYRTRSGELTRLRISVYALI